MPEMQDYKDKRNYEFKYEKKRTFNNKNRQKC